VAVTSARAEPVPREEPSPAAPRARFRPSPAGYGLRATVGLAIGAAVLLFPLTVADFRADQLSLGVVFAIIGLSVNILMGHGGQIPLGHQAFVGVGAFTSAYLVTVQHLSFYAALPVAGLTGAVSALLLGFVALRLRGLYLALVTLAYGAVAERVIFNIRSLTGGGAGLAAPRPAGFEGNVAYLYLCLSFLALFLFVDWRLMRTRAGRAIVAVRTDERVAASMGINVTGYKLFAFVLSGFIAGIGGSLFAHANQFVAQAQFDLALALTWVLMTVVGGLESRAGVVIGSMFFALFPLLSPAGIARYTPLIGAALLLLTLIRFPGGIGQQLTPLTRWLSGGPLRRPRRARIAVTEETPGAPRPEVAETG
jgi:branched-chain amino acid transport system permease protein